MHKTPSRGKTVFVFRLIDHVSKMIDPPPNGEYQEAFARYHRVVFYQGLPEWNDFDGSQSMLLIIDDLMQETN